MNTNNSKSVLLVLMTGLLFFGAFGADHSFPASGNVTGARALDATSITTNDSIIATITITNNSGSALNGVFVCENLPAGISLRTVHVRVNGSSTSTYSYSASSAGAIYTGLITHTWVLESPTGYGTTNPVNNANTCVITYVLKSPSTGTIALEGCSWAGKTGAKDGDSVNVVFGYCDAENITVSAPPDVTPPVISALLASGMTETTCVITWTTNELSSSIVEYGLTAAYGDTETVAGNTISHSVTLTGLTAGTNYHFMVRSADASPNVNEAVSGDNLFSTLIPTSVTLNEQKRPVPSFTVHAAPDMRNIEARYFLPQEYIGKQVSLDVFTVQGRLVRSFVHSVSGRENRLIWDGRDFYGRQVANGKYIFIMRSDELVMKSAFNLVK